MAKNRIIDLSVNNRQESIQLVVNPASFDIVDQQNNQQVTLLDVGTVNLLGERGVKTITLQSFFPSTFSPLYIRYGGRQSPVECRNMLEKWKNNKQTVRVIIADMDINLAMNIDNLSFTYKEGDDDIYFNIIMTEYKTLNVPTVKVSTQVKSVVTKRPATSAPAKKTYTIKKGDTLWSIAKKYYKNGSKYTTIYNANKDIIEKTAKKHGKKSSSKGHWIWAGTKLVIP